MRSSVQLLAIITASLGTAACGAAEPPLLPFADAIVVSYEAIPSAQLDTWDAPDLAAFSYEDREVLTLQAHGHLSQGIIRAVELEEFVPTTQVAPGGYLLTTNPSLQAAFPSAAVNRNQVQRFAAAQGYVLRQWDILVTDFAVASGNTGYAVVEMAALTPARAQAFFAHAAAVDDGLGGGYTAFGDTMLFLNLRADDTDVPYSGLDDRSFIDALDRAAQSFSQAAAAVIDSGERAVEAWFVSNDWDAAGEGQDFAAFLDDSAVSMLNGLRTEHDQMVTDWLASRNTATTEGLANAVP